MTKFKLNWDFNCNFYPGILLGMRTFEDLEQIAHRDWNEGDFIYQATTTHLFAIPFVEFTATRMVLEGEHDLLDQFMADLAQNINNEE